MRKLTWRYSRRHGLDHDDLSQHVVVAFLRSADGYDPSRGSITTWTTYLVRSACERYLVLRRRRHTSLDTRADDGTALIDLIEATDSSPAIEADRNESAVVVRAAMGLLSRRHRDVLAARFGLDRAEKTQQEIADEWGVSRQRVSELENTALASLWRAYHRVQRNGTDCPHLARSRTN